VLPAQQPFGHDVASQTQLPVDGLHSCPAAQAAQLAPPVPHEAFDSDAHGTHVFPRQQPFGHEVASQTHWPVPLHSWPDVHAPQVAPPAPHEALVSLCSGSHAVPLQHPAQDAPPHVHAPLEHDCPEPHGLHETPPVPHSLADCEP
jgi:hypothetical protein